MKTPNICRFKCNRPSSQWRGENRPRAASGGRPCGRGCMLGSAARGRNSLELMRWWECHHIYDYNKTHTQEVQSMERNSAHIQCNQTPHTPLQQSDAVTCSVSTLVARLRVQFDIRVSFPLGDYYHFSAQCTNLSQITLPRFKFH